MRLVRFVRVIQLDESGVPPRNGSSDKHRDENEKMRPPKLR